MQDMARKEDKDGKIQGFSLPEIRAGLKRATLRLQQEVRRAPGKRPIEYGLVLSRLAAWFLTLDDQRQKEIILRGERIIDALLETEDGPTIFEGQDAANFCADTPASDDVILGSHSVGTTELVPRREPDDEVGPRRPLSKKKDAKAKG